MPKLIINKDTTLFRPIEIELEGKLYTSLPMSPPRVRKLIARLPGEQLDIDDVLKQLGIIFGVEPTEFENVDYRDLHKILDFVGEQIVMTGEKYKGPVDEKNSLGPEGAQLP